MKLARRLPTFGNLIIMEVAISLGIITFVVVGIIPHFETAVKKAQLSQLFFLFGAVKVDRMVNMALTGEGYSHESVTPKSGEKLMSTPKIAGVEVRAKTIGNAIRYEGSLGEPFYLTFAPSVIAEGTIGTVLWLCGNKKSPSGWTQPGSGTDLPPEVLPFVCRDF